MSILNKASTLSSLNEYLTWDRSMKPPSVGRELEACFVSAAKVCFLTGGSGLRLGGGPPPRGVLLFFSSALTRATSSCAVWPCSLELLPGHALDNPHLNEDWSEKVVATRF